MVSPHVSTGGATCPFVWAAALGAAQPCVVSLTTRGISPANLRYDRLTLWFGMRGLSAAQATPSCTVYRLTCHRLLPCLRMTFAMVPDVAWSGSDQWPPGTAPAAILVGRLGRPSAPDPWGVCFFPSLSHPSRPRPLGSCSPACPLCALCCVCGVLGHLVPDHRCACSVRCVPCAVSWATWLLFTGVHTPCVVSRVRCPGPSGSCSPVCPPGALRCLSGVLGYLAPVHWCARSVRRVVCSASLATWLLFTSVLAHCVVLRVRCPGPSGSCSPVCPLGALRCVFSVLGHLAPGHRCARSVCCVAPAVAWATWLFFTSVPARCVVCRVRCPGPPGFCPLVCRSVRCVVCSVSWATLLLFIGALARCVVLPVQCPRELSLCSPVCLLGVLCAVCGVLGLLAPFHFCAARCVALCIWCPGPLGSCSPVCSLGAFCCVCGVLCLLPPVHRCARLVRCVVCSVSLATWSLFTGALAWCVAFGVRCPGP